jgi:hypothetical protein
MNVTFGILLVIKQNHSNHEKYLQEHYHILFNNFFLKINSNVIIKQNNQKSSYKYHPELNFNNSEHFSCHILKKKQHEQLRKKKV